MLSKHARAIRCWLYRLIAPTEVRALVAAIAALHASAAASPELRQQVKQLAEQFEISPRGWLQLEAELDKLDSPFGDIVVAADRVARLFGVPAQFASAAQALNFDPSAPPTAEVMAARLETWRERYPKFDPKAANRLWELRATADRMAIEPIAERKVSALDGDGRSVEDGDTQVKGPNGKLDKCWWRDMTDDRTPPLQLPSVAPSASAYFLHPNSEVNWPALHRALPLIEDDAHCATCGELTGDDRWHFLIEVQSRSDEPQMIEAARAYALWLHHKRHELITRTVDEMQRMMFRLPVPTQPDDLARIAAIPDYAIGVDSAALGAEESHWVTAQRTPDGRWIAITDCCGGACKRKGIKGQVSAQVAREKERESYSYDRD